MKFGEILINPLIPIERELKKSSENSDKYAGEQIAKLINSHKDVHRCLRSQGQNRQPRSYFQNTQET
jgi:hypothetical protein